MYNEVSEKGAADVDTKQWMAVLLCLATALMLFVTVLSYRNRHLPVARTMIFIMLGAACYSLGYAFEILSESLRGVKLSLQLEYLGIPFISAFWLLLVIQFTGAAANHRRWLVSALFVVPAATFALHLTNDWHHLIYEAYVPNDADAAIPVYTTIKGPWYTVHAVYNYTILLFGCLLFVPMYLRALPIVRKQIVVLIMGAAAPMLFNIAYMFNHVIDFTPLGFAASGLFYAWGIFRFDLLRLTPLAFAKVFDKIRDGVVLFDHEERIVNRNQAAVEAFPELMSLAGAPKPGSEALAAYPDLLRRLAASDGRDDQFVWQRFEGNSYKHYRCTLTPIYDSGNRIGILLMLSDVTELMENQARLHENARQLSELNAFKDKLFTVVAHDIRDPIAHLVSLTELLGEAAAGLETEHAEVFQELRGQVGGTFQLVDNLLDWYRSQNGQVSFRPLAWNVRQVVRQALSLAGPRAEMKRIRMTETIDGEMTVTADKEMLDLILRNLLSNAIKFTGIGGEISVGASRREGAVCISVSDNGAGIDEETSQLLRREQLFFKGEGEVRFGLVLAREFLRIHGGSLRFDSTPGQGATFVFMLPDAAGSGPPHANADRGGGIE